MPSICLAYFRFLSPGRRHQYVLIRSDKPPAYDCFVTETSCCPLHLFLPMPKTMSYSARAIQALVDLGNADINILYRSSDAGSCWQKVQFASVISTASTIADHPARFTLNKTAYLVGGEAASVQCEHTGQTDSGKVANALPLTIYGFVQAVGLDGPLAADIVFTCPSTKAYGADISDRLLGQHTVTLPGDALALVEEQSATISIHSAKAQLEGHQAFRLVQRDCPQGAVLVDIGSRTIITTVVDNAGRIQARQALDDTGCGRIIEKIFQSECLVGMKGLNDRLPSADRVRDYLFNGQAKNGLVKQQAARIAEHVLACVQETLAYVQQFDKPVYLMGGGALIPGIINLFSNNGQTAAVLPDPTWATLNGLAKVADRLFDQN